MSSNRDSSSKFKHNYSSVNDNLIILIYSNMKHVNLNLKFHLCHIVPNSSAVQCPLEQSTTLCWISFHPFPSSLESEISLNQELCWWMRPCTNYTRTSCAKNILQQCTKYTRTPCTNYTRTPCAKNILQQCTKYTRTPCTNFTRTPRTKNILQQCTNSTRAVL